MLVRGMKLLFEVAHTLTITSKGTRRAENPPEIIKHPISMENLSGENVEMLCQVQGYPEPRVEFYKEGRLISCNENNNIGRKVSCQGGNNHVLP